MKKRIVSAALGLCLLLGLAACGAQTEDEAPPTEPPSTTTTEEITAMPVVAPPEDAELFAEDIPETETTTPPVTESASNVAKLAAVITTTTMPATATTRQTVNTTRTTAVSATLKPPTLPPLPPTTTTRPTTTTTRTTTTTTRTTTTTTTTAAPTGIEGILNSVSLSPTSTGYSQYDAKIADIIGSGTTYQKIRRGYKWLAEHLDYQDYVDYDNTDSWLVNYAYSPLFYGRGSCKNYSAATHLMLRYIGIPNAEIVDGNITNSDGSVQYHVWNVVTLGGVRYIVDAEVEGKVYNRKGSVRYFYFFADPATYDNYPRFPYGSPY